MADHGCSVAHAVWVFARRGVAMESFAKYLARGVNMTLGTDTCPQSMLEAMKFAAVLSKTMERQTETTTAADVFNAATLGGARAVGRDDLGRIAVGAKADLLLFDAASTWLVPLRDPIKNVVYSGQASDVHTVMVNGKIVMRDGEGADGGRGRRQPRAPGGRRPDVVADGRPRLGQAPRRRALAAELPGLDGVVRRQP